jgi:NAD(P)H-binding
MLSTDTALTQHHPGKTTARRLRHTLQLAVASVFACLLLACASPGPLPPPTAAPAPKGAEHAHHTVALLGASGMVGEYLLREALARGYTVRVLARTPAKLAEYAGRIAIIQGDARDPAAIAQLLQGADVVISALGPVKSDGEAARFINTTATGNVLQAMQGKSISQYMVVSGAAVVMPGDERDLLGWWIRTLAQVGLRDELEDKQGEYELLAASRVDWMLVRCPLIDAQPARGPALASTLTPPAFRVRAGEVAEFMLDQIDARQFVRAGPFLGSGEPGALEAHRKLP